VSKKCAETYIPKSGTTKKKSTIEPHIKDPWKLKDFKILNSVLCNCEYCNFARPTSIYFVILSPLFIINLLN
jgi:hypothetical protein